MERVGAGGMGEVYRARDPRLGREVAVKILPSAFASDAARVRRFEQEARAAAALHHPNLLAVHDVGTQDDTPYIVSELLSGETLRTRLRSGPLPVRKAVEYALQIARGLAAAHDKGIVHRDLKPENIFLTRDGQVKILDFGLAKLMPPEAPGGDAATHTIQTDAGMVVGTVGYMSPEQVRGKATDARSDLFSFGAILYEMLSGQRAFQGDTTADTITAILTKEPPELSQATTNVPTTLEHIVRHCVEKNPEQRFHSAHDIAFDLEMLSSPSASATTPAVVAPPSVTWTRTRKLALAAAVAVLMLIAGILIGRNTVPPPTVPYYQQITFRRGTVGTARFAPDGQVVYSASWEGNPVEVFIAASGGRGGSTSSGIRNAEVESISRSGEILLLADRRRVYAGVTPGTLARVPLSGAAPRAVLEDVEDADWSPDGSSIAVARYVGQRFRLEFPIGKVLYESDGYISHPRVSPKGDLVAFLDHPVFGDDAGRVAVVDLSGRHRMLSPHYASTQALAWTPSGDELWFSAATTGSASDIYGVDLRGKVRTIARAPGGLRLLDISRTGRVVVAQGHVRRSVMTLGRDQKNERDLAIADWSLPKALTPDGSTILIEEEAEGTEGGTYSVYLRKTDGSAPIKLGEGTALGISPDGRWVLTATQTSPSQLVLLPTGAGEPRKLTNDMTHHSRAAWLDSQHVIYGAVEPGHRIRVFVQNIDGGKPRAISPEGIGGFMVCSPDRKWVAISGDESWIVPVDGGPPRRLAAVSRGEFIVGWSSDARSVYLAGSAEVPRKVFRVDLDSGKREIVKQFAPADPAGVDEVGPVLISPDGRFHAFGYGRYLTDMYSIEGLK